jgi:hypothetical protein
MPSQWARFDRRYLELHRALSLVLHNHRSAGDVIAKAHVAHAEAHQVGCAQFAVDAQVKERQLSGSALHLQTHPDGPDLPEIKRCLLTHEPALVPTVLGDERHAGLQ